MTIKSKVSLYSIAVTSIVVLGCMACMVGVVSTGNYYGHEGKKVAPTMSATAPLITFGEGTFEVGTSAGKILPGKYGTIVISENCYWERLSNTSNSFGAIIANANARKGSNVIVTLDPTDVAFHSSGCGTWSSR